MRNDNDRVLKVDQKFFQPSDGIQVQMVRRLVHQKDIRFAEKGPGQKYLHLLIAGQILHHLLMQRLVNSKSVQQVFRVGLGFPAVHLRELTLQLAGFNAVLVGEIRFCVQGFFLLHDIIEALIAHNNRIHNRIVIKFEVILLQHTDTLSRRDGDRSVGCIKISRKNL